MHPLLLPALLLAACDPAPEDTSHTSDSADLCATAEVQLTWANFGDGFFLNYCRSCHSEGTADRFDAPDGINFDTRAEVQKWRYAIRVAVMVDGGMPVGGGVYQGDLDFLDLFLECGLD